MLRCSFSIVPVFLTFCSPLLFYMHVDVQTRFLFTTAAAAATAHEQHHYYSTNCVFFAFDSISLSHSHFSIRRANFFLLSWLCMCALHSTPPSIFRTTYLFGLTEWHYRIAFIVNRNCFYFCLCSLFVYHFCRFFSVLPFVRFDKVRQLSLE